MKKKRTTNTVSVMAKQHLAKYTTDKNRIYPTLYNSDLRSRL